MPHSRLINNKGRTHQRNNLRQLGHLQAEDPLLSAPSSREVRHYRYLVFVANFNVALTTCQMQIAGDLPPENGSTDYILAGLRSTPKSPPLYHDASFQDCRAFVLLKAAGDSLN